ncbi:MAG: DUF2271 domain-containing protein [Acidobacteriota bacterium]|nr:DUF2271 domain-containing protein [Acidobacteriota bacterium]
MIASVWIALLLSGNPVAMEKITVELVVPVLKVRPYHRPYVAVWLETTERKGVRTIAVWHEQEEWLKDMRQWWRKLGRNGKPPFDGVSGATRKPGTYTLHWEVKDSAGRPLPPGEYYLNIEAAREEGGRDFLRQKVQLGARETQEYTLAGDLELGKVVIKIN